ncbi:MAG: hypothetical protein LBC49_00290 [Bacteroidales bacterium]|jgi:hypothetical protein|nr:hypothetical protein [Bacteroidales bacterium]
MSKIEKWLVFWTLFISIGAFGGTIMMWIDTTGAMFGMTPMLPCFEVLPFSDIFFQSFFYPGLFLTLVNGIPQFITAVLLLKHHRLAALASVVCGVLLMLWICVQVFIVFGVSDIHPLQISYFIFGLTEFILALILLLKKK